MEQYRVAAAAMTGLLGLIFLVGFFKGFLGRTYLGLLGGAFIILGASFLISSPHLSRLKLGLFGLSGLFFLGAVYSAVSQTLAQFRLIRERRAGLEREMWEYLEQLKQRNAERGQGEEPQEASAPDQPPPADAAGEGEGKS